MTFFLIIIFLYIFVIVLGGIALTAIGVLAGWFGAKLSNKKSAETE